MDPNALAKMCTPNSHKSKEEASEDKKIEKVIKGTAKKAKKSEIRKMADVFIADDVKSVKSYVLMEVLVPAVKNLIVDIVTDGVNMIFGTGRGRSKSSYSSSYKSSFVDYRTRMDDRRTSSRSTLRDRYSYDDVILDSRADCEEVLLKMDEIIDMYGVASVADLFDLVGITGDYTDNKYGWTNLRNADVIHTRDGYKLKMPKALPIQ